MKAGLGTLVTGEVDYPTEVKAKELPINLVLVGHRKLEVFEVKNSRLVVGLKCSDRTGSRRISCIGTVLSY